MLIEEFSILAAHPWLFYLLVALFSLCVGSFLNVVIYRLPLIMKQEWDQECREYLEIPVEHPASTISLSQPPSHCPECKTRIRWYMNIPLLSWAFLRGKCAQCSTPISCKYPAIELLTAVLSVAVAVHLGPTIAALFGILLVWMLIPIFFIDHQEQIIPDRIVYPLIGIGLFANIFFTFTSLENAVWGALIGFLFLWVIYIGFKVFTGKEGMGYGDFKLLSALGAWLGVESILGIVIVSSLSGCVLGLAYYLIRKQNLPFAFGTHLAIAGLVVLFYNPLA